MDTDKENHPMNGNNVIDNCFEIHDVTLREGDQHAGVAFSVEEKMTIASRLVDAGITSIQAGFPSLSRFECDAVTALADSGLKADFHCLCRYEIEDIDLAASCKVNKVGFSVPGWVPLSCSDREKLDYFIKYGKEKGLFLRISCEDVARSDLSNIFAWFEAAQAANVDMVTIADTVGRLTPTAVRRLTSQIKQRFSVPLAVHFHNDLGLATANTLAALEEGARQIQVSIGGLGERAGIASLEEVVMILTTSYGVKLPIDTTKLYGLYTLVREYSRIDGADTKPIVGRDVFTHECGLHVGELVKNPLSYNPFDPRAVGRHAEFRIGKHTTPEAMAYFLDLKRAHLGEGARNLLLFLVQSLAINKIAVDENVIVQMASVLRQAMEGQHESIQ